jgi:hypothetical protein
VRTHQTLKTGRHFAQYHPEVSVRSLAADILSGIVAALIHSWFFHSSLFLDVYGLILPSIFLPYMLWSKRVRRVFQSKDWDAEPTFASFTDQKPRRGIIYTESELESMSAGAREPSV